MADSRRLRGLVDTSVVIDLDLIEPADLPLEIAVSAITMAELAAGPHAAADPLRMADCCRSSALGPGGAEAWRRPCMGNGQG